MKKILLSLIVLVLVGGFFIFPDFILAQAPSAKLPTVYFFYGNGCPHCADEEEFFAELKKEFSQLKIVSYEVWYNQENIEKLQQVAKAFNIKSSGVPITIIGNRITIGFGSPNTTGKTIRQDIEQCLVQGCEDEVGKILGDQLQNEPAPPAPGLGNNDNNHLPNSEASTLINLPLLGVIDVQAWSLPLLTIAIGALDGFNPCAMWVLIFLISLLLGMEDRKKMWILGAAFILTSSFIYFLFLAAWLNFFLFIGFISYVRIAIGLVAIGSGIYHLREWYVNKSGLCKVTNQAQKKKIMDRLKRVSEQKIFLLALGGIISVALAVNMVELVCSAGLPAVYAQVLSISNLTTWEYYAYLVLYIVFFMLDDMIVFAVAMITLRSAGLSGKYSRWSSLIGGVVIFILGILLIFKPAWIMFS